MIQGHPDLLFIPRLYISNQVIKPHSAFFIHRTSLGLSKMCFINNLIYLASSNLIRIHLNSAECIHHITSCTLAHFIFILNLNKRCIGVIWPCSIIYKLIHFTYKPTGPQEHWGTQNMHIIMRAVYNSFEFNVFGNVCAGETGTSGNQFTYTFK